MKRRMAAIVAVAAVALSCTQPAPPPAPVHTDAPSPRVILPDGFAVEVETATNDEARAQGLMFRDRIREGTGMLFLFAEDGEYPFWMKNTLVPLDIIWVDANLRVVRVKHGVPPCRTDPCPSYAPEAIARYVLELGNGQAGRHRVEEGTTLQFERLDHLLVR